MPEKPLDFSIIIPSHGRPESLRRCLRGVAELEYPRERVEAIVVDDGSPTPLDSVVVHHRDRVAVRTFRQENTGPAGARNAGADQATMTHLAFLDDDCVPDPHWLHRLSAALEAAPDHLIGGRTINALEGNWFSSTTDLLVRYLQAHHNTTTEATFFTSNNFALRAEHFHRLQGFDTGFPLAAGEDREFCRRWLASGLRMSYASQAVVYHSHALNLRGFWRQHYSYGRGASLYHAGEPRSRRQFPPERLSFYLRLLRFPLTEARGFKAWGCTALMGVSQLAHAVGYFREGVRRRKALQGTPKGQDPHVLQER